MNIELTEKEFRLLLDLVYTGNWIMNSARGDDRIEDYDNLQEKIFQLCPEHGMRALVKTAASTRQSRTMRTRCSSTFWPRKWRGGIWRTERRCRRPTRS